jgi:lysophospholipase L1-like esterase
VTISRRKLFLLGAAAVAVLAHSLWPASRDFRNLPPAATGTWIAFGDSLTEGHGAVRGSDYPAQLAKLLGVNIENHGVSGETSAAGLKRLPALEAAQPAVVFLCFGGNDVLQGVKREEMISNVAVMIDRFHARGSFVVLLGIRGASLVGDRNDSAFRKLAKEKRVLFVPNILDGVLANTALMSDYVHPNEAGYGVIAAKVSDALAPVAEKLKR